VTTVELTQNLIIGIILVCISIFVQVAVTLLVIGLFSRLASAVERRPAYWLRFGALACLIL
jgi:hypothetical protein